MKANGEKASFTEVEITGAEESQSSDEPEDLTPALAGGSLLGISFGVLAFALRFVRREGAFG